MSPSAVPLVEGDRSARQDRLTTPAGLQMTAVLFRRRLLMAALNVVTWLALLGASGAVLGAGGWTAVDVALLVCVAIGTPWTVLGFWNAVFGLWLLHGRRDGLAAVAPFAAAGEADAPIEVSTAILMTVRNEDPARAIARLQAVQASLDRTPWGHRFAYFVLSDTSEPEIASVEEAAVAAWRAGASDPGRIVYRRRLTNEGFKAGNLRDFCERWGDRFELMLPLDADSVMTGDAVLRLVRIMQAHPRLGILQSLVVGLPSQSAFARIFQFGMRHGMRSYTMGSAWWAADCGPFWGHNAVVRIAPFRDHCELPVLPGTGPLGGRILSHDQVEAVLMRRAGYEVRVMPVEGGSYEENPPTLTDFARRDLRWCQGNMQYKGLLRLPGLLPMSRFQLAWAILMFLGAPAWTAMIALAAAKPFDGENLASFPAATAAMLYVSFLLMSLAPKLAGLADIALTRGGVARYGGALRFVAGAATEVIFAFLVGAVSTFKVTVFLIGLLFGKAISWGGQARDARAVSWGEAARLLWPETLFGLAVATLFLAAAPTAYLWSLPLTAGYLLAMPFAVLTAWPALGRTFARLRLCAVPEEIAAPAELAPFLPHWTSRSERPAAPAAAAA